MTFHNRMKPHTLLLGLWLSHFSLVSAGLGEEIHINLASAEREPLVEVLYPRYGSKDRLTFNNGMHILQRAGKGGKDTGVLGVRAMLSASGNFSAQLAFQINKLGAPQQADGHGLRFIVALDEANRHYFAISQLAHHDGSQQLVATKSVNGLPEDVVLDRSLKSATFEIRRFGTEVVLSIIEKGGVEDLARFESPMADVGSVEIWSSRDPEQNGETSIVLKSLKLESDEFYASKKPPKPWLASWQIAALVFLAATVFLLFIPKK